MRSAIWRVRSNEDLSHYWFLELDGRPEISKTGTQMPAIIPRKPFGTVEQSLTLFQPCRASRDLRLPRQASVARVSSAANRMLAAAGLPVSADSPLFFSCCYSPQSLKIKRAQGRRLLETPTAPQTSRWPVKSLQQTQSA